MAMTILTIESVCHDSHVRFRKKLSSKPNYVVPHVLECARSLTPSYIISSVGNFAKELRNNRDKSLIFVFPFSLMMLKKTDTYEIVVKILKTIGLSDEHHQTVVCIDGNVNSALEEMFDSESCSMTIEELENFRLVISGKQRDTYMFISKDATIVRL